MFLTNTQAEQRLNSEKNLALRFSKNEPVRAFVNKDAKNPEDQDNFQPLSGTVITEKVISLSGKNRINLTKDERNEIAIDARTGIASQSDIAKERGLNFLTVHNIASGKTKGIDEDKVAQVINTVRDRALDRLMQSLGLLTDDKLSGCTAKDLSLIASNMGRVVEKIQDKTEKPDNINFIIYAPELKQERAYETVEI
jgi:hypothetical protein